MSCMCMLCRLGPLAATTPAHHRLLLPPRAPTPCSPTPCPPQKFTLEEIAEHNRDDDVWLIIDGKVYDVSQ